MPGRDFIVIGGSAGSVKALPLLVRDLPADLPASIFVAVHLAPYVKSLLPEIIGRAGPLPAHHPRDLEPVRPGVIYVAPPDHHLLVHVGFVRVVQGPMENQSRPAIDPLFRTAAVAHGPRVTAVLLGGYLDDGIAGLAAVKECGGTTVVQDPRDADYADMPANALRSGSVDYCLPLSRIAERLTLLAHEPVASAGTHTVSESLRFEAAAAEGDLWALEGLSRPGKPSPFSCPDCQGVMWEISEGAAQRYRCRTGHAFSPLSLLAGQSRNVNTVLNESFRALMEKKHLLERLARNARRSGNTPGTKYYEREKEAVERYARDLSTILLHFEQKPVQETLPEEPGASTTGVETHVAPVEETGEPLHPSGR